MGPRGHREKQDSRTAKFASQPGKVVGTKISSPVIRRKVPIMMFSFSLILWNPKTAYSLIVGYKI